MKTKICVRCKEVKPISEFHKNSRSSDGLHSYCKDCNKAKALAHIQAEKDRKSMKMALATAADAFDERAQR
jgi:hypothetical protein